MENSKEADNIFLLTENGVSKIEWKKNLFHCHSHKENTKPIILNKTDMKKLCSVLPDFINLSKKVMESEEPPPLKKKKFNKEDDEEEDDSPPSVPNRDWKKTSISKFKNFETRLSLNTWDNKPYVWLKLYFNPANEVEKTETDTKSKKRKILDEKPKMLPCRGGVIFNDVDIPALSLFVNKM